SGSRPGRPARGAYAMALSGGAEPRHRPNPAARAVAPEDRTGRGPRRRRAGYDCVPRAGRIRPTRVARARVGARGTQTASRRAAASGAAGVLRGQDALGDRSRAGNPHGHRENSASAGLRQASSGAGTDRGLGAMTPHDWYIENRAAYVARALEPS